jgi:hypothetical protein
MYTRSQNATLVNSRSGVTFPESLVSGYQFIPSFGILFYRLLQQFMRFFPPRSETLFRYPNLGIIVGNRVSPKPNNQHAALNPNLQSWGFAAVVDNKTRILHGKVVMSCDTSLRIHASNTNPSSLIQLGALNGRIQRVLAPGRALLNNAFANGSNTFFGSSSLSKGSRGLILSNLELLSGIQFSDGSPSNGGNGLAGQNLILIRNRSELGVDKHSSDERDRNSNNGQPIHPLFKWLKIGHDKFPGLLLA